MPTHHPLLPRLQSALEQALNQPPTTERQVQLLPLIAYINQHITENKPLVLNFICTHNSRRSQMAQIWAQAVAYAFGINAKCLSGGVEVTAFNPRAIKALQQQGFLMESGDGTNPHTRVTYAESAPSITAFSKLFDDPANATPSFAAVMTCAHADENCPFIPGASVRIPVRYDDPGAHDGTPHESDAYLHTAQTIAAEMAFVFSHIQTP